MRKLILALAVAAIACGSPQTLTAADEKPKTEQKANRALPFRGKLDAVDKQAKTIKVGERTFQVLAETKIAKAGKPATLDDAKAGEEVAGAYREGADKKLNLVSLRIGAKPDAAPKKEDKK